MEPKARSDIEIGRAVIADEIAGLEALRDSLDARFAAAIERLAHVEGRVIVTGMGKSGHIGRKIAATLASTGAPAIFVHAAEASHGDLGMIGRSDMIVALSKSGETAELNDVLNYAARHEIAMIAITANRHSTLAHAADIVIELPDRPEASGDTQAPTTSSTMMAALGDAIAVTLLRRRGFSTDDFRGFHPGGKLGASLRRVRDLMHGPDRLPLAEVGASVESAAMEMTTGGFGCVGVVDAHGELVGVITDGDLRRHLSAALPARIVDDVMTRSPRTAAPTALAGDILAAMSRDKITALFVVDDAKPIGLVHIHDCLERGVI